MLRPAGGIVSAPCQDRFTPCPLPPSAGPLLLFILMMVLVLNRMMLFMLLVNADDVNFVLSIYDANAGACLFVCNKKSQHSAKNDNFFPVSQSQKINTFCICLSDCYLTLPSI